MPKKNFRLLPLVFDKGEELLATVIVTQAEPSEKNAGEPDAFATLNTTRDLSRVEMAKMVLGLRNVADVLEARITLDDDLEELTGDVE